MGDRYEEAPVAQTSISIRIYEGQVLFCITPDPPILGVNNLSTSEFFAHV